MDGDFVLPCFLKSSRDFFSRSITLPTCFVGPFAAVLLTDLPDCFCF